MTITSQLDKNAGLYDMSADGRKKAASDTDKNQTDKNQNDFDLFIKLMVAQMKNQDPTDPMDATEYVSQLATFSMVQQTTKTNSMLAGLGQMLDQMLVANSTGQAASYVGKYLTTETEDGKTVGGFIESVSLFEEGLVATLDDGTKVLIGPGVTISKKAPEGDSGGSGSDGGIGAGDGESGNGADKPEEPATAA